MTNGLCLGENNGEKDMNSKLHILQHSLGLDQYGAGRQYRNHFVTGEGSDDFPLCRELVAEGLMTERAGNELSGGSPVFFVTRAGIDFVAKNSPAKPPEKKLTRSQRRYREWLRADCGLSFAEWIGAKA